MITDSSVPRVRVSTPTARSHKAASARPGVAGWVVLVVLIIAVIAWVFPVWLTVINAVKGGEDFVLHGPLSIPLSVEWTNVATFWNNVNFPNKLWNSIQISFWTALIGVTLSLLTAFAIGIGKIRFRLWVLGLFMIAFTIPQEALVYPVYNMAKFLNLYDNIWSVIIFFAVTSSAFGAYMLTAVLADFPEEVLEAARLDGAGSFRVLRSVVLPIVRPTLTVLAIFFFIWTWNEFLVPLVLLPSNDNQTVSLALGATFGQYTSSPTTQAAAALLGIVPSLLFFLAFQRTLLKGITLGSVK